MTDNRRPWELVTDPSYFKGVLGNFVYLGHGPKRNGEAFVRFGLTGTGHGPNYQIECSDGRKIAFRGMGHSEASNIADAFEPENISEPFTYDDVVEMLKRLT